MLTVFTTVFLLRTVIGSHLSLKISVMRPIHAAEILRGKTVQSRAYFRNVYGRKLRGPGKLLRLPDDMQERF
jgi:hypothetical protein